ncbi:uncharacterized protein LOC141608391 [Silene latifolia]|uniref:uncharacterized protein LOC141608391 n=1 Tax=Silene latifolia TaxID=37657 RepID=UPI003D7710B0
MEAMKLNSTITTRSIQKEAKGKIKGEERSVVRLMCSMGGKVLPRPYDNELRYVGGSTHLVTFQRNISYASFMLKLLKVFNVGSEFTVKYQLPNQGFDSLISVLNDEDVENMMEEFEELDLQRINNKNQNNNEIIPRMRLFLLPPRGQEIDISRTNSNASEASDYLFGLENSNSGSPAFGVSLYATQPPLKTKLESPNPKPVDTGGQLCGQGLDPGYPYPADQASLQNNLVYYIPAEKIVSVQPLYQG